MKGASLSTNDKRRPAQGLERKDGAATSSPADRGDHYLDDTSDHRQVPFADRANDIARRVPGALFALSEEPHGKFGDRRIFPHSAQSFVTLTEILNLADGGRFDAHNVLWCLDRTARLVAFDIDGKQGYMGNHERWAEWSSGHGLGRTLTVRTGDNGVHVLYRVPDRHDGVELRMSRQMKAAAGVDKFIRPGGGGLLVGAGSIHPDTGRRYVWADPTTPIAELTDSAVEALTAPDRITAVANGEFYAAEDVAGALAQFPETDGWPSPDMLAVIGDPVALRDHLTVAPLHPEIYCKVTNAVRLGLEGHTGLRGCLMVLGAAFVGELDRRHRFGGIGREVDHALTEYQQIVHDVLDVEGLVNR